ASLIPPRATDSGPVRREHTGAARFGRGSRAPARYTGLRFRDFGEGMSRQPTSLLREPSGLPAPATTEIDETVDLQSIYAGHRDFVWLTLQRMGVRRPDLEDVFQDVFMIVHKRL